VIFTLNLFKKAAICTDLHVGLKSNSVTHNEDCLNFITWFCDTAKQTGCETCLFLGDWHHHRATINVLSLGYSAKCLDILSKTFDVVYLLIGNHDLYFRDKRDTHSMIWAKQYPNIVLINEVTEIGDVTLVPWLVQNEYEGLAKKSSKYLFGHLELPHFFMNSLVVMPDHGGLNLDHITNYEQVFSGHFHKRQFKKNVCYVGNCFPHNFADVGDDERGMGILEWGKPIEFKSWPGQPVFRNYKLSTILDNPGLLLPNSHIKVDLDIGISYDEALFIREQLIPEYCLREMSLIQPKTFDSTLGEFDKIDNEPTEQIIHAQIASVQSDFFDPALLLEIYHAL